MRLWATKLVWFQFSVSKIKQKSLGCVWELRCKTVTQRRGEAGCRTSVTSAEILRAIPLHG